MTHPELARIASTLGPLDFPKKFAVETCAECNLACSMCYHPGMKRLKGVMPLALWRRLADEIASVAPRTECWFSFCGEPLLEPDRLFEILDYGQQVGLLSLNVNTNGMLLDAEVSDRLLASGAHLVVVGIDGFTAATYERARVGADRDTVYGNVEHLLRRRDALGSDLEIQVQFIEMDDNRHELAAYTDHWLRQGAVVKVRRQLSWGGKFETSLCVPAEERIPCPWAITMMHVFWDGRVPRCPGDMEGEEGVGNAWEASIVELWAELGRYRTLHLAHDFDALPDRCHSCQDWMTGAADRIRPAGASAGERSS
ncbi:MAG TPA: radical SAM/SPASM domain-containing protein [Longimicrobiales bacterium]|nr:radical SAM/SPASM domain-containing protein [Longimicrobiales bacterium]